MKRGYTIIELMIALGIGALLVALAIPRFTAYQQYLEFEQQARIIQQCMQSAADQIVAPSGLLDGTSKLTVTLANTGTTSQVVTCGYAGDDTKRTASTLSTAAIILCTASSITYDLLLKDRGAITNTVPNPLSLTKIASLQFVPSNGSCSDISSTSSAIMSLPVDGVGSRIALTLSQ